VPTWQEQLLRRPVERNVAGTGSSPSRPVDMGKVLAGAISLERTTALNSKFETAGAGSL